MNFSGVIQGLPDASLSHALHSFSSDYSSIYFEGSLIKHLARVNKTRKTEKTQYYNFFLALLKLTKELPELSFPTAGSQLASRHDACLASMGVADGYA